MNGHAADISRGGMVIGIGLVIVATLLTLAFIFRYQFHIESYPVQAQPQGGHCQMEYGRSPGQQGHWAEICQH